MKYNLGDIVVMKKNHPCGNNKFEIVRVGADIKIRCVNCSRVIMLSRIDFNKGIRKVIGNYEEEK
ncbi:MAG: DUF951 domain-containing protein [Bacilli bacterium]|nr:DUF951 domain-containing protein [Bacilli bacterium]MDY5995743.1 DUF951 domain-containing protein [Bacilli bacterium]MEE1371490.1 DUF951 domain-containing protein [Bacilli bacterium]